MALKSFGRGGNTGETGSMSAPRSASTPAPKGVSAPSGLTAFIDQGSDFEGKLSFRDTVRIDGRFQGEIRSENTLIVGESGEIDAKIQSQIIAISGTVDGDIVAAEKVVLHKTARVTGNIETPSLVMEEGAVLNGVIKMNSGSGSLKAIDGGAPKAAAAPKSADGNGAAKD
jgi:cytoskeletal protein CcmA (bactofilin family)